MNKGQLFKALEAFSDDIQIEILSDKNYKYQPRVFYSFNKEDGEVSILLVTSFEPLGRAVELKV